MRERASGVLVGERMTTLREFRTRQLVELKELERLLLEKYPEKADRVRYIVDALAAKLGQLRRYSLFDYLFTVHLAAREFPEFEKLMPSSEEVDKLLENGEE